MGKGSRMVFTPIKRQLGREIVRNCALIVEINVFMYFRDNYQ